MCVISTDPSALVSYLHQNPKSGNVTVPESVANGTSSTVGSVVKLLPPTKISSFALIRKFQPSLISFTSMEYVLSFLVMA